MRIVHEKFFMDTATMVEGAEAFDMFCKLPPFTTRVQQIATDRSFAPPQAVVSALLAGVLGDALRTAAVIAHAKGAREVSEAYIVPALKYVTMSLEDADVDELAEYVDEIFERIDPESATPKDMLDAAAENAITDEEDDDNEEEYEEGEEVEELEALMQDVEEQTTKWDEWEPEDPMLAGMKEKLVHLYEEFVADPE